MKLSDISNGSDWVIWVIVIIMAILSVVFISGHGSMLIAGYNTASDEEKAEYDVKKLCRVLGLGFAVITVVIFIMGLFENVLPASFIYIAIGIILADLVVVLVLGNTICKKR